jgi:hypothetical protein
MAALLLLSGGAAARFSPLAHPKKDMALPTHIASTAHDPRSIAILAKTIYRELRTQGYAADEVMTLAGELLEQVTSEVKDRRDGPSSVEIGSDVVEASG